MKEFFKGVMHMTIEEMKEKKREHGYTYNMMSQMSGVPLGTVQKIFTGETKSPRYDTLEALARIFENGDRVYRLFLRLTYSLIAMIRRCCSRTLSFYVTLTG